MPNYVYNTVRFSYKDMDKVKSLLGDGFDFNRIIPMPESLNIVAGSVTSDAEAFLAGKVEELTKRYPEGGEKPKPEYFYGCKQSPKNMAELEVFADIIKCNKFLYGHTDWYGWCNAKWDTKWNASSVCWDSNSVYFETAWCSPERVFVELSKKLGITFRVECEEESLAFCSITEYSDGQIVDRQIEEGVAGLVLLGYTLDDVLERYDGWVSEEELKEVEEEYRRAIS